MSGKMEHQLASKRSLKLDTVGASAMCGGSLFHGPTERTWFKTTLPTRASSFRFRRTYNAHSGKYSQFKHLLSSNISCNRAWHSFLPNFGCKPLRPLAGKVSLQHNRHDLVTLFDTFKSSLQFLWYDLLASHSVRGALVPLHDQHTLIWLGLYNRVIVKICAFTSEYFGLTSPYFLFVLGNPDPRLDLKPHCKYFVKNIFFTAKWLSSTRSS